MRLLTQLVLRREPGIDRLTFDGIELTFVQDPDGALRLQGAPASAAERASFALEVPPDVEVNVRDSHVVYLDQERNRAWDFQDVTARMHRESGTLLLEARARPPSELGSRIVLTAQARDRGRHGGSAAIGGCSPMFAPSTSPSRGACCPPLRPRCRRQATAMCPCGSSGMAACSRTALPSSR